MYFKLSLIEIIWEKDIKSIDLLNIQYDNISSSLLLFTKETEKIDWDFCYLWLLIQTIASKLVP